MTYKEYKKEIKVEEVLAKESLKELYKKELDKVIEEENAKLETIKILKKNFEELNKKIKLLDLEKEYILTQLDYLDR